MRHPIFAGHDMRMLVVENDVTTADAICASLERAGHAVNRLGLGKAALAALQEHAYALMVLELGLPDGDGGEVLRRIRATRNTIPVLVISPRAEVDVRVRTLDLGADDYLVKPFTLTEFDARVRALLRRRSNQTGPTLTLGRLSIDFAGRRVMLGKRPLHITAREFALLETLVSRQNRVTSRERAIEALCTWNDALTNNGLDIAVHRLRRKLDGTGVSLRTLRGLGYALEVGNDA